MIMSSSVSLEAMFVWRLFADGKLTVASATLLSNKVARQSCSTLLRVWHGLYLLKHHCCCCLFVVSGSSRSSWRHWPYWTTRTAWGDGYPRTTWTDGWYRARRTSEHRSQWTEGSEGRHWTDRCPWIHRYIFSCQLNTRFLRNIDVLSALEIFLWGCAIHVWIDILGAREGSRPRLAVKFWSKLSYTLSSELLGVILSLHVWKKRCAVTVTDKYL